MKTSTLTLLICLTILNLKAQTDVTLGLNGTKRILATENIIYVTNRSNGTLSKIHINDPLPTTATEILSGLSGPFGMAIKGNDLYFTQFFDNKVSKIDVTQNNPQIIDVISNISAPTALVFNGNELYIAIGGSDKISKIDITESSPTLIDVVTVGLQFPLDLTSDGTHLYILDDDSHTIFKIDFFATIPATPSSIITLEDSFALIINGTDLYYNERLQNKVYRINTIQSTPEPQEFLSNISVSDFAVTNNELYLAEPAKITKTTLETLSATIVESKSKIDIFPNPAINHISISNLNTINNYTIYDVLGKNVSSRQLFPRSEVSVAHLKKGIYFLRLENYNILRFIKQ